VFSRIFYAALIAGAIAGLFASGVQAIKAWPLILTAEVFEQRAEQNVHPADARAEHAAAEAEWSPAAGLERIAYTAVANVLAGIGFALLLAAAYALKGGVDWQRGLLWGFAGFATFALAPALGLPPQLPGSEAAPLLARQAWWLATVAATGGGLALLAFAPRWLWKGAGALLLVMPHVIGAPGHSAAGDPAPVAMAHAFVVASLLSNLLFWLALGVLTAIAFNRLVQPRRSDA
jgi:cobalt transporter subunit CbtA